MSHPNDSYGSYSHNHYNDNHYSQNAPYNQQQQYQQYSDYTQTSNFPQPNHFQGQALYSQHNYSASQHSINTYQQSEYASSVYALNPQNGSQSNHDHYHDDPSHATGGAGAGAGGMPMSPLGNSRNIEEEKRAYYEAPREKSKKRTYIIAAIVLLLIVAAIVGFCIYWFVVRPKSTSGGSSSSGKGKGQSLDVVSGGNGTKILLEDGTSFTYTNPHGGWWYYDVNDPFNNGAKAQSWSPGLNETFNYGVDKIRGVNLGGWLTIEPFISPALFEKYINSVPHPVDEWTLHQTMAADTAGGGLNQIEDHYKTFITEKDFAEIAAAGLNYVRLPLPFWAIETRKGEPFLPKVAWKYFIKALGWARKYGIRVNLDFHAVPGSQNGWNHSGRLGEASFLHGPMGYANAQRTLDYIRVLAEFISQPQYKDVVTLFGIINEPRCDFTDQPPLAGFYAQAYQIVRDAGGPWVSIHDCMMGKDAWASFLPNADRLTLDTHPYMAFGGQDDKGWASKVPTVCQWGKEFNSSQTVFGLNNAGEWSLGINDCGLYLNGVDEGVRYEGRYVPDPTIKAVGSCDQWTDWENYSDETKGELKTFVLNSMDALQNYFFWTWKIGPSLAAGKVVTPAWSYQLGLENGWIPQDPREATGACGNTSPWIGPLKMGNGNVNLGAYAWPPTTIKDAGPPSLLPSYVPTGTVPVLEGGTISVSGVVATKSVDLGSGWNKGDKGGMNVEDPNCNYLDAWIGTKAPIPTPLCGGPVVTKPTAVAATSTGKTAATGATGTTVKGAVAVPTTTPTAKGG
ncbi:glycoside hydrolase [Marasmius fiardii PR-910]|nr:glycoside hydrolase [Marasmius fiardii PR-910]